MAIQNNPRKNLKHPLINNVFFLQFCVKGLVKSHTFYGKTTAKTVKIAKSSVKKHVICNPVNPPLVIRVLQNHNYKKQKKLIYREIP